jgi:hypothetical protein
MASVCLLEAPIRPQLISARQAIPQVGRPRTEPKAASASTPAEPLFASCHGQFKPTELLNIEKNYFGRISGGRGKKFAHGRGAFLYRRYFLQNFSKLHMTL